MGKSRLIALVDCNSFYASCERVFRPDLINRPIAVLSNNDGCVVAMSAELKKLGIGRGIPWFQVKNFCEKNNVAVFSSNYALYQDLSNRIFSILQKESPGSIEQYSIDEAFVHWNEALADPASAADSIIKKIKQQTGVPVSIGMARSRTLSKLANHRAKKGGETQQRGFFHLTKQKEDSFLQETDVSEIWGIGRQKSKFLKSHGILNAFQLRECDDSWIAKKLSIVTLRTVKELRGEDAVLDEDLNAPRKGIISSRSFSRPITCQSELFEAIALYCARAVEKLTSQGSLAGEVWVSIGGNRFAEHFYSSSTTRQFSSPTDYLPDITAAAREAFLSIYRDGERYVKAGVGLFHLSEASLRQGELFGSANEVRDELQPEIDQINKRFKQFSPSTVLRPLSCGIDAGWQMKRNMLSPRYTTCWDELAVVK